MVAIICVSIGIIQLAAVTSSAFRTSIKNDLDVGKAALLTGQSAIWFFAALVSQRIFQ